MDVERNKGLFIPEDLGAWQEWQLTNKVEYRLKKTVKKVHASTRTILKRQPTEPKTAESLPGMLHTRGEAPEILVVLDSTSSSSINSLVVPLRFLESYSLAVWAPSDVSSLLPGRGWSARTVDEAHLEVALPKVSVIAALGHYMAWGGAAYRLAQRVGARFITVQHGLHTPYAPPLAPGTHLLAFSQADAEFWISGRDDITYDVVGSQLFWEAAQSPSVDPADISATPVFLGQMHGAELPRASFARASIKFTREHKAIYRPHPSEKDKLSRLTHSLMGRLGTTIDSSRRPLNQVNSPVVSIFSTGVLEAALRGVPAWVYHPHPPAWLKEFWDRYGMNQWGSAPTPAPQLPEREPAEQIATILTQTLES